MSSFVNSNFDMMSVEEIMAKLNEMQVRYSVRKDTSREYLLQVLKHHTKKVQDTPASVRNVEEVVFREVRSQPRVQYSSLEATDIMKRAKENRFSVGGVSRNLATTEGLRQRDVSPQNRMPQGPGLFSNPQEYRNEYSSYQKSIYSSEMDHVQSSSKRLQQHDMRGEQENFGRIDFGERTAQKNQEHRAYQTERKSMGYMEHVAEMVEQNRACYSDTQLLKGPIDVNYNELLRERQRQRHFEPSPNRVNKPEKELNFRSPVNPNNASFTGVERFPTFGPIKEEKEQSNKKWFWRVLTILSILILLFYLTVLLPNYIYGQRTPIVYASENPSNVIYEAAFNAQTHPSV